MENECKSFNLTACMMDKAAADGVSTSYERMKKMKPCPFGDYGTCCKACNLGPCRLNPKGDDTTCGNCGATAGTIAARNFARMIAAGAAAHSDHGREVAHVLIGTARGEIPGYEIKDEEKLNVLAGDFEITTEGKDKNQIAEELGQKVLDEFGRQEGELYLAQRAPEPRKAIWRKLGIFPRGIDREIAETMHRTCMGVDQDYHNIISQAMRLALANGWGGSMIGTEIQDVLFGTPVPIRGKINLGVLEENQVNVIVHGHEPLLSEMIVQASQEPELLAYAKKKGAEGINIAGLCCTANEVLQRHGVPVAGNFSQQELALVTGTVEAMVVDVQCIMQSLPKVASHYHTHIITTSRKAKIEGALHMELSEKNPLESAEAVLRKAIDNYPNRDRDKVKLPGEPMDAVAGFSHETINYILGGRFRGSYGPLNENIINGRILGVAGVVGCDISTPESEQRHLALVRELIANNVLVLQTGCAAQITARNGLMTPEAAQYAGDGLAEVCQAVGIPPVLHCGACVDDSRLLIAGTTMVKQGGLGEDICDLPVVGCCPEWMSEKALAIGMYFVASGVYTVFGPSLPMSGSKALTNYLTDGMQKAVNSCWGQASEPSDIAKLLIGKIKEKRKALGIDKAAERVLYDMAMRRELEI
jgi:carbon-monoxide dehydrogenase catalytic subunit